jgi:hypothetical protein
MTADRNRKLAELADIAQGVRYGIAAFDDRAEEMGPGIAARGNGRGGKGAHSDPTEAAVTKPATVVSPAKLDRLVDRAHAAVLDLDAAYGEIARTTRGMPAKGEPSCAWCAEAVQAAAKVEAKEGKAPVPLDYRSPTYLFAEVQGKGGKTVRALVCEWCYRFNLREERKPSVEERWVHIQGGRMPKRPLSPSQRAAQRVNAS